MISTAELSEKTFIGISLPAPFGPVLGEVPQNFSMVIWGVAGSGKSTLAVSFAFILAEHLGKGIYCSSEEGAGPSMQDKVRRMNAEHPQLFVKDFDGAQDLLAAIRYSGAAFIVFDSASMSHIKTSEMEELIDAAKKQGVAFIYVLHATKTGDVKGNSMLIHKPDIELEVTEGTAKTNKNRFAPTPQEFEINFVEPVRKNQEEKTKLPGSPDFSAVTPAMLRRSKARFDSARQAWMAIEENTGLRPANVRPDHTEKSWRWKIKNRKNPKIFVEKKEAAGDVWWGNRSDRHWNGESIDVPFKIEDWHFNTQKAVQEFQLKGIEFGNWMSEADSTQYMAFTMQGIDHLTRILGMSHNLFGLAGRIGLAFGARGSGIAAAHYEPNPEPMINLTKFHGQDALAHEYAHALDNVISAIGSSSSSRWVTGGRSTRKQTDPNLIKKTDVFGDAERFFNTLFWTKNGKETTFNENISSMPEYWQRRNEVFARTFEAWVSLKADQLGLSKTNLVKESYTGPPYPSKELIENAEPHLLLIVEQMFHLTETSSPGKKSQKKPANTNRIKSAQTTGKNVKVDFKADASESHKGTYQLIEADQIIASHNKDCSVNSKHRISKGQPRDRSIDNLCAQPKFIAKNLNPDSITRGNLAFQGAPVVSQEKMVIQGNGRSIALKIAYDEIPKQAEQYKKFLKQNAGEFGFSSSQVEKFKKPVLARTLTVSDKEAIRLGNIVDTSQAKLNRIDQAKALIRNLKPRQLQAIGNIIANSQGETLGAIIDDTGIEVFDQVKDLDRTGLVKNNQLTPDGKEFLRSVLTGIVFDSEKNRNALRGFLDLPRTIQAGIERSFGSIVPLINQKGDIRSQLQEAVIILAEIKRNDAFDSVQDVISAADLFDSDRSFEEQSQQLATFLLEAGTQKMIRDGFRVYIDHINGSEDLFNPVEAVSELQAFNQAFVTRANPVSPLSFMGITERVVIVDGKQKKELQGEFPTFLSPDKLFIVPSERVKTVKSKVNDKTAIQNFEEFHNYTADEVDFQIDFPETKAVPVGTAYKIWYSSDKIIQPGDRKGKKNHYVHTFDRGKRQALVKGDVLIIGNIEFDRRGLIN